MPTHTLTHEDLRQIQAWGRIYAQTGLQDPLQKAAEYIVVADPEDRPSLRSWWEEGVRNNVKHMGHFNDVMLAFEDRIKFVQNNN